MGNILAGNSPTDLEKQPNGDTYNRSKRWRDWRGWPYLLLGLIVLLGLAIRLYGLGERTMTHIETYVPGIHLPAGLSDPSPRLTVKATLLDMIYRFEPHPPGYYLFMLGWTRVFGAGIEWLRLPSVIFGTACILLVFFLGMQEKNQIAGLLAALFLALNGHQVFWSQLAKNYVFSEFIGLAATIFLLLALRGGKWERWFQVIYLLLLLLGVSLTIYFWPILVVHMIWVIVEKWEQRHLPGIFQVQYLVFLLGTPLISLAIFQARRPSYLDPNFLPSLARFLEFGYSVEVIPPVFADNPWIKILPLLLLVIGVIFLGAGLWKARQVKDSRPSSGISSIFLLIALLVTVPVIVFMGKYLSGSAPRAGQNVIFSALLPVLLIGLYFLLRTIWMRRDRWKGFFRRSAPDRSNYKLSAFLAILPVLSLAAASPAVVLFESRGILLYTPYLLLTIAAGGLGLIKRSRLWVIALLVILLAFPVGQVFFRNSTLEHPTDYKTLAEKWIPEIQKDDVTIVRVHWATTPIFYYLDTDQFNVVGVHAFNNQAQETPNTRLWVLRLADLDMGPALEKILLDYSLTKSITARGIQVDLYESQKP